MVKKKNSVLHKYWWVIAVGVFLVVGALARIKVNLRKVDQFSSPADSLLSATKDFQSEIMDFSVEVPRRYEAEEKFATVTFSSDEGRILVAINATNFDDLDSYMTYLDSVNKVEVMEEQKTNIGSNDSVRRIIEIGTGERQLVYDIYVNGSIYTIFTDSPDLYDDLDQIAQSFRYTPN